MNAPAAAPVLDAAPGERYHASAPDRVLRAPSGGAPLSETHTAVSLLTLSEVHKAYGAQDVLQGVSFFISPGRRVGLIGANGTGKTTILNLITGSERADSGRVP